MNRFGITIPFLGAPIHAQRKWIEEVAERGYTDLWSAEADGTDGFTPLAVASVWAPELRLGCAVIPAYTRGPALLAMSVASMAQAAPGRFVLGLGSSSPAIVERWNGIPFEKPYARVRDTLRFLRRALAGEKVDEQYESFRVQGFRLGTSVGEAPPILLGALRPGMLKLAGREGDGAILNYLSAEDVRRVVPIVKQFETPEAPKEIVARLFVCPSPDADAVRGIGRFMINGYLNTPVYAAFHRWLGRDALLAEMWAKWEAGDRKGAAAAVPDRVIDDLLIHGPPEACREHIQRYVDAGVDTPMLMIVPAPGVDPIEAMRQLAPR